MERWRRLTIVLGACLATAGVAACGGHADPRPVLAQQGGVGDAASLACGDTANLQVADVTARRPARVLAARLLDATPGLRAVDVLGAPDAVPRLGGVGTVGSASGRDEIVGSLDGPSPEDLAVHLPGGVPISRDPRRPTALFVTVVARCPAARHLSATRVEVTVRSGGALRTQVLRGELDVCVGPTAPETCP